MLFPNQFLIIEAPSVISCPICAACCCTLLYMLFFEPGQRNRKIRNPVVICRFIQYILLKQTSAFGTENLTRKYIIEMQHSRI